MSENRMVDGGVVTRLRGWLVAALEDACERTGHRWGCRLASWSCDLNNRWGLNHWTGEGRLHED